MRVRYSFGCRHTGKLENIRKQRVKFPDVMKDVIRISDIVLQVMDARFIKEMRNVEVDELIREANAKTIYVLNKSDLVVPGEIERTLPSGITPFVFVSVKTGRGLRELREKIMMEAKKVDLDAINKEIEILEKADKSKKKHPRRERIQIGIIGYPNAGKSSLINRLGRRSSASTSKQAGHTRGMQKIRLTSKILMLDTPGVIPESKYSTNKKEMFSQDAKLGARTYSSVKDPEDIVSYLMTPLDPRDPDNVTPVEEKAIMDAEKIAKSIEKFYKIDSKGDPEILIEELGMRMNFLKKGGKVDIDRAARIILRDWQIGTIRK